MTASVPSVPLPPRRPPLWLVVLVVPLALLWPSKRPTVRAILWSRFRLALVRLRVRLRGYRK